MAGPVQSDLLDRHENSPTESDKLGGQVSKVVKNRNIAAMMKKKREDLKDQRTNRWTRKYDREKWVSSKDVYRSGFRTSPLRW